MLKFTRSGLLMPNSAIISNLDELRSEFVTSIPTTERISQFDAYMKYSDALKKLCHDNQLTQWIDGSFVTKRQRPRDIDVVTFIDAKVVAALGESLISFIYPKSETNFQVDGYVVAVYSSLSSKYYQYEHDKAYWTSQFDKTRRNRAGNKLPKGFLEITF